MIIWSGYKGSSDNSTWSPPNGFGSTSLAASPFGSGTGSSASEAGCGTGLKTPSGGGTDSTTSEAGGTTGDSSTSSAWISETWRLRDGESDMSIDKICLLWGEDDGEAYGETWAPEVDASAWPDGKRAFETWLFSSRKNACCVTLSCLSLSRLSILMFAS